MWYSDTLPLTHLTVSALRRTDPWTVRTEMLSLGFDEDRVTPMLYRPLDSRWFYWEDRTRLLDRPRIGYRQNVRPDNRWIGVAQTVRRGFDPSLATTNAASLHVIERGANMFPAHVRGDGTLLGDTQARPNLSASAADYASALDVTVEEIQASCLAVLASHLFTLENESALVRDWPRIPLAQSADVLRQSVDLGERVAQLLDPLQPFSGGAPLGTLSATIGSLDPATDLAVTARWGIAGKRGITMPSTGKLEERPYTEDERQAIAEHAGTLGLTAEQAIDLLGQTCFDVYLNDKAYWRCVPSAVWRYTIGGYQVIKKWLSYRERALLGRDLKPEEARYVTEMVRRIAALVLMQPELDANYERVKADVWEWER